MKKMSDVRQLREKLNMEVPDLKDSSRAGSSHNVMLAVIAAVLSTLAVAYVVKHNFIVPSRTNDPDDPLFQPL